MDEDRFRIMADSSPFMIWVHDPDGAIEFVNKAYCDFFGVTQEEVVGEGWRPLIHPDDAPQYISTFLESLRTQSPWDRAARVRRADGQWRWVHSRSTPRFSDQHEFLGVVGSSPDITEQKEAEQTLQVTAEALLEATECLAVRNEELQQFVRAAAHDLRSPLNSISSSAELLALRLSQSQSQSMDLELVNFITRGVDRMSALLNDLLSFAQASHFKQQAPPIPLERPLRAAKENLKEDIESTKTIIEIASPLPEVPVHEAHMLQLFQNLISNSIKYRSKAEPHIRISARREDDGWRVSIQDNGLGIPADAQKGIFKPFVRLHGDSYPGSGIGLATCQKIVAGYGGKIWVESEPGKGSTFFFTLLDSNFI
jgi:PAS domain S-box-containing protein